MVIQHSSTYVTVIERGERLSFTLEFLITKNAFSSTVLIFRPWSQILKAASEENIILLLSVVSLVALAPVVGDSVGEDGAVLVEAGLGDGLLALLTGLQFGPGVFVPEGVAAVTSNRGESSVHGMEGDVVDGENVLESVDGSVATVTLEGEVVLRVGGVDVLYGHPPLHAAQSEPSGGSFLVPEY